MPNVWDFFVLVLAVFYGHCAYFRGSLFAGWRAYYEARKGTYMGDLMTCPLCQLWVNALLQLLVFWLPGVFLDEPWKILSRIPLLVLALSGAVWLIWTAVAPDPENRDIS